MGYQDEDGFSVQSNLRSNQDQEVGRSSAMLPSRKATVQWIDSGEQTGELQLSSKLDSPLQYSITESWDNHYMPLVMNKFLFDVVKSVYNAIPAVVSKADEDSALYQACHAVGRAYMANTTLTSRAVSKRSKAYATALGAIHSAIQDPEQRTSDNTLLGVWLLSLYEVRPITTKVLQLADEGNLH